MNYTPKEVGKYVLDVGYDGIPIPGSPFEFEVTEGGPDKVKVYGKGKLIAGSICFQMSCSKNWYMLSQKIICKKIECFDIFQDSQNCYFNSYQVNVTLI